MMHKSRDMQLHETSEKDRQEALRALREEMQKIRDSRPDDAAVAKARGAIERLLEVARRDTGQSRIAANFLLAWWNAGECGGFDLTDLWAVDRAIAEDMVSIFSILPNWHYHADILGYEKQFQELVRLWRPDRGQRP